MREHHELKKRLKTMKKHVNELRKTLGNVGPEDDIFIVSKQIFIEELWKADQAIMSMNLQLRPFGPSNEST